MGPQSVTLRREYVRILDSLCWRLYTVELEELEFGWWQVVSLAPVEANTKSDVPFLHTGFVDSHLHVASLGQMRIQVDLRGCRSIDELVRLAREALARVRRRGAPVLYGFGWSQDELGVGLNELASALEGRLPEEVPVFFSRVCGHSALINKKLRHDFGLAELSCFVTDRDLQRVMARLPRETVADVAQAIEMAQDELVSLGFSAVGDLSLGDVEVSAWQSIVANGHQRLDVQAVASGPLAPLVIEEAGHVFQLKHYKKFLDGSFGSRTAWLSEPYCDASDRGDSLHETRALCEDSRRALEKGFLLSFHAIGDAALDQVLEVGENLREELQRACTNIGAKHRLEHLQLVRDDQIVRLARQPFWALHLQPHHRIADQPFVETRLGEKRLRDFGYRCRSFIDAGLSIALGSDAPVDQYAPQVAISAAQTHPNVTEQLTFEQALWHSTTGARLAMGLPLRSLSVGARVRVESWS